MSYYWEVTKDHSHNDTDTQIGIKSRVGCQSNPSNLPANMTSEAFKAHPKVSRVHWRTKDDDGNIGHEGYLYLTEKGMGSELLFTPLDDLSGPDLGCVDIEIREGGKWVIV